MAQHRLVYIGTYTAKLGHVDGKATGILIFRMDAGSGALTRVGCRDGIPNPSYVAVEPRRRRLYAVSEVKSHAGGAGGTIHAYAIAQDGALAQLNQRATGGMDPCFVDCDASGSVVMAANYTSGSIIAYPLLPDGAIGEPSAFIQHELPVAQAQEGAASAASAASAIASAGAAARAGRNLIRQEGPHAHSCVVDPANARMYACDLGCDRIFAYRLDRRSGALAADDGAGASTALGSGPRHLAFHPDGRHAYAMLELSSQIGAFRVDAASGRCTAIQAAGLVSGDYVSQVPAAARGVSSDTGADLRIHPSGRFLYASHRGSDCISAFAVDPGTGMLTLIGRERTQGKTPRGFAIDPSGTFLLAANQDSDTIVTFRIDQRNGRLVPTGQVTPAETPVCIAFLDGGG